MPRLVALGLAVGLAFGLAACTSAQPEPEPSTAVPAPSEPAPSEPEPDEDDADGTVTFETTYGEVPFTIAVRPVERAGDTALVTMDWTLGEDVPGDRSLHLGNLMSTVGGANLGQLRLVDLERAWVAWPGAEGGRVATSTYVIVRPGETATSEALFAAPPGEEIDVLVPLFGLVEAVPVVDTDGAGPRPAEIEPPEGVVYPSATLESFSAAYDETGNATVEGDEAVVTLASDVLFAFDEFTLTSEATATVADAAERIAETAQAGDVVVVGHTDDQGSDAYNLDLSRRRADSVADQLRASLGDGFTITADGMGASTPVAEGTGAAARAANRRVEIRFTTRTPGAVVELAALPVPEPRGAVAAGNDAVVIQARDVDHEVTVQRVVRRGGYLVGTLQSVSRSSSGDVRLPFLTAELGPQQSRGFGAVSRVAGALAVALAGEGSWVYPVDYRTSPADAARVSRAALTDRLIVEPFKEEGWPATVTVVWPDTGQDTVTVDVEGKFRITDVPVEESS